MPYEVTWIPEIGEPQKKRYESAEEAVGDAIRLVHSANRDVKMTDLKSGQVYSEKTLLHMPFAITRMQND